MDNLHVREAGDGEPLVLLHAFPADGRLYGDLLDDPPAGFRVIAPDLPGFGRTPPGSLRSMSDLADVVVRELDARSVETFQLAGTSMGGYLAFAILRKVADRVTRLLLVDTQAGSDTSEARERREAVAQRVLDDGVTGLVNDLVPKLLGATTRSQRPDVVELVRTMGREATPEGVAAASRAMASRPDSRNLLGRIEVPTVVVVGEEDEITPPEVAEEMAERIPGGRLEVVKGAGHLVPVERPDAFRALL